MAKYIVFMLMLVCGCSTQEAPESPLPQTSASVPLAVAPQPTPPTKAATLTRIADPSTVCMVNDRYMGVAQIPVVVEGKTYYGCCQMCEKRLHDEPSVRRALDPISKQEVDKAMAVLAKDASGAVFYFADEASLAKANGDG